MISSERIYRLTFWNKPTLEYKQMETKRSLHFPELEKHIQTLVVFEQLQYIVITKIIPSPLVCRSWNIKDSDQYF